MQKTLMPELLDTGELQVDTLVRSEDTVKQRKGESETAHNLAKGGKAWEKKLGGGGEVPFQSG